MADRGFVGLDDDPDDLVVITSRNATRNHRLTHAEKEANRLPTANAPPSSMASRT